MYRSINVTESIDGVLLNQGVTEVIADAQGEHRQPYITIADIRVEKEFDFCHF
jgi:hypothetical protein